MSLRRAGIVAGVCLLLGVIFAGRLVQAQDVSVGVGDTILQVSGQTSPNAFVTISQDGGVIGTTSADASGNFSQTYPAQQPGLHQLTIFADTITGLRTDTITLDINITEHGTTTAEAFLPPAVAIQNTSPEYDERLAIRGETYPNSTIAIYIDNSAYSTATADAAGLWSASLYITTLAGGPHSLFVRASDSLGAQSHPSAQRYFAVPNKQEPTPPTSNVPHIPTITFPASGDVWHESSITVQGTSDKHVQIELWNGADLLGSVWSDNAGQWSLPINLDGTEYSLRVRACIEDTCSAFSGTVQFTYQPGAAVSPTEKPLHIAVPKASFVVFQHEPVILRANVLDGQPPYSVVIEWDTDTTEKVSFRHDELTLIHRYAQPGEYTVGVNVRDSQGRSGRVYFSILVKPIEESIPGWTIPAIVTSGVVLFAAAAYAINWRAHRLRLPK